MSDDRMDRAERIRRMREGNRNGRNETEPASTIETASDTETEQSSDGKRDAMAVAQRAAQTAAEMTRDEATTAGGQTEKVESEQQGEISAALTPTQGPTGVTLPDQDDIEEAMEGGAINTAEGATEAATIDEEESTQSEELVRVLEFALGDEYYCLDIEYVEEIVKRDTITRVPNTADYVEGVVDLRGQITTILDPKSMMEIDSDGEQSLMVVFDPEKFEEQGAIGWIVDEVRQVAPVAESAVNKPPVDADYINGVVDRDEYEQFVIWVEPDDALESAIDEDDE